MHKENVTNDFEVSEIIEKINELSKKHENPHKIKNILTIVSLNNEKSYVGSIKVSDEDKLPKFEKNMKKLLDRYGKTSLKSEEVIPCCSPPYINIRFKIKNSE